MSEIAIRVEHLGKAYQISHEQVRSRYRTLQEEIIGLIKRPFSRNGQKSETFWALKDISFEVKAGEALGIIGRNGAGKSTLLKVLSRITRPTTGYADIYGRVGSLLEVGTGFHPELTGRENIYLNGAVLGMTRRDIRRRFDEIVAFAEVERFLDTPVKRYSSGMYMRLAFSVAAHLEPEILVVDEVLAVGDAAFQKKCLGKMGEVAGEGRTVLFVSHNLGAIDDLCPKSIWLDNGALVQKGNSKQVIMAYITSEQSRSADGSITEAMHVNATGYMYFTSIMLLNDYNESINSLFFGQPIHLQITMDIKQAIQPMRIIVVIETIEGTLVSVLHHTDEPGQSLLMAEPGNYIMDLRTDVRLAPGIYCVSLAAKPAPGYWENGLSYAWVQKCLRFSVDQFSQQGEAVLPAGGVILPETNWNFSASTPQAPVENRA